MLLQPVFVSLITGIHFPFSFTKAAARLQREPGFDIVGWYLSMTCFALLGLGGEHRNKRQETGHPFLMALTFALGVVCLILVLYELSK